MHGRARDSHSQGGVITIHQIRDSYAGGGAGGGGPTQEYLTDLSEQYQDAVNGLEKDREVLRLELQRLLAAEREREAELSDEREARRELEQRLNETEQTVAEGNATDEALVRKLRAQLTETRAALQISEANNNRRSDGGGGGGRASGASGASPWGARNEELERMRKDLHELRSAMEAVQDDLVRGAEELAAAAAERDGAVAEVHTELSVLQAERMKLTMQARTTSTRLDTLADDDHHDPNRRGRNAAASSSGSGTNEGELRLRLFEMEKQAGLTISRNVLLLLLFHAFSRLSLACFSISHHHHRRQRLG